MQNAPVLEQWVMDYARARYGKLPQGAEQGWRVLLETVYSNKAGRLPSTESVMCARPALNIQKVAANGDLSRPYSTSRLWDAVNYFLQASDDLKASDTYRYDLVDVMRQCLSDLSLPLQNK